MPAVSLLVPRPLVKTVKTALQARGLFARRIDRVSASGGSDCGQGVAEGAADEGEEEKEEEMFLIATTLPSTTDADKLLADLSLTGSVTATTTVSTPAPATTTNPLTAALTTSLLALPLPPSTLAALLATAPKRYSIYPPLLLLPSGSFTSPAWQTHLPTLPQGFFAALASALHCTHLAINAPIPSTSATRAPLALTPLHGTFTAPDLWVRCTQNGIHQTWPPARCMFSRGNIGEKARVLGLAGVRGAQVVDLYAGIGYFTFSYAAAGAARVWCWEVSAWSAEALRRGAGENGWVAEVVDGGAGVVEGGLRGLDDRRVGIVVFRESNEFAVRRLRGLGVRGVAHVNMGYLPDCKAVWPAAVEILDAAGGVAHVHANVAVGAEEAYSREVVGGFAALLEEREGGAGRGRVGCEHVEVVKTFAPGVVHCVFDIRIEGRAEAHRCR